VHCPLPCVTQRYNAPTSQHPTVPRRCETQQCLAAAKPYIALPQQNLTLLCIALADPDRTMPPRHLTPPCNTVPLHHRAPHCQSITKPHETSPQLRKTKRHHAKAPRNHTSPSRDDAEHHTTRTTRYCACTRLYSAMPAPCLARPYSVRLCRCYTPRNIAAAVHYQPDPALPCPCSTLLHTAGAALGFALALTDPTPHCLYVVRLHSAVTGPDVTMPHHSRTSHHPTLPPRHYTLRDDTMPSRHLTSIHFTLPPPHETTPHKTLHCRYQNLTAQYLARAKLYVTLPNFAAASRYCTEPLQHVATPQPNRATPYPTSTSPYSTLPAHGLTPRHITATPPGPTTHCRRWTGRNDTMPTHPERKREAGC
jgi:hypothetical protein